MDLVTSSAGKRKYKDKLSNKEENQYHCHCETHVFRGFTAIATNYLYSEDTADQKAPYDHDQDSGSATVGGAGIAPSPCLRMGSSFIAPENLKLKSVYGYTTSNDGNTHTIAICKVTPTMNDTTDLTPVALYEEQFTGLSSNSKLIQIDNKTFTNINISKGDIVFTMVKGSEASDVVHWHLLLDYKIN